MQRGNVPRSADCGEKDGGSLNCGGVCHLAHGGGEGLCEGDDEAGDLGGLLGHHADLVPVGAAGESLDDGAHDWLQELRLGLFSITFNHN